MTKMNRRDYLIGMGATAGVLAGGKLDLLARNRLDEASSIESMAQNGIYIPSGPNAYDLLPTESVKLVFHGLMGIVPESPDSCKVGFHSLPSRDHRHRLKVMAFKNCQPMPRLPSEKLIPTNAKPVLVVDQPDLISGVKFYQPPDPSHRNHFGHVIDLEGTKWYPERLSWNDGVYKPTMRIKNGLFYTLLKTTSTFKKQRQGASPNSTGDPIGSIASYVGVNIYLKPGGSVTLRIPEAGIDLPLVQAPNVRYEIHFNNNCLKRPWGTECDDFRRDDAVETRRNDFYMHRDAVEPASGDKYQLVFEQRSGEPGIPDICPNHTIHRRKSDWKMLVTDEAPCAALGYGYGGWPPYPPS